MTEKGAKSSEVGQHPPAEHAGRSRPRKPRQTRAERSEATRRALFHAAAEVVGEVGYGDALVSRITARANVAQGTFYNYFASRQDLFDQLLPSLGSSMLEFIQDRVDILRPWNHELLLRVDHDACHLAVRKLL